MATDKDLKTDYAPDSSAPSDEASENDAPSDATIVKRLVRKTDALIMPGLALAYFTHTLDRANLGNAKTDGIESDLGLAPGQFNLVLVLFYVPYALLNLPWAAAAKRFNPAVVIPAAVAVWGAATLGSVASRGFAGLMASRVVMGAAEAAYKPCEMYYLSLFYTRREIALRASWIGQMGFIAGAVSGLISWSVFQWDGKLHGWQYLFIIQGSLTVGVAILLYAFAPRSAEKCPWFTEDERAAARVRLEEDSQDVDKHYRWADAKAQLARWQTWAFAFMALMYGVGVASSSNFLPTLVQRLTHNTPKANLYTVGPNLTASVIQLTTMWCSDRYQQRAYIACGTVAVSLLAWILLGTLDLAGSGSAGAAGGYFLTYLITFATFTPSCLVPLWMAANVPTTTGKAVALGLSFTAMNLAGIVSSLVFRPQDAPVYRPALVTVGTTQGVFVLACLAMRQYYARLNRKLDSGELAYAPGMENRPKYRYAV